MDTKILTTAQQDIRKAAELIAEGKLVAFPTETVYGLGADALNAEAVSDIYRAKGRPSDNPMIVHIASAEDMDRLTGEISEDTKLLMANLWPGPLTIIVKKTDAVPKTTTGGLDTVAVRMPDSETARLLIKESGCPIAAPSANISGRPSPTRAADVIQDMSGRIDAVINGEDCRVGIESTVIDMTGEVPTILRPGIITAERIEKILGKKVIYDEALTKDAFHKDIDPASCSGTGLEGSKSADSTETGAESDFRPKSPGMKYKHYAPKAEMEIISGTDENVRKELETRREMYEADGKKVGVIYFDEHHPEKAAHDFFARLRDLDNENTDIILAGALNQKDEVGFAVMNRMIKSAGYNIIYV